MEGRLNTLRTGIFFLYINHKSLIQSKVTFFYLTTLCYHFFCCFIYCAVKCVKSPRVLKGKFASSVFQSCKGKTPNTRKLVSGPQCGNICKWFMLSGCSHRYCRNVAMCAHIPMYFFFILFHAVWCAPGMCCILCAGPAFGGVSGALAPGADFEGGAKKAVTDRPQVNT
jgi:hypothetical protein